MIKLDISTFVSLYILVSVIAVLIFWIFFEIRAKINGICPDDKYIWRCNICLNIYVDSLSDDISTCPNCGSYITREQNKK